MQDALAHLLGGFWRCVLCLEFVKGLTLKDFVAIRCNRPGTLLLAMEQTPQLLPNSVQPDTRSDVQWKVSDAHQFASVLSQKGLLECDLLVYRRLLRMIELQTAADRSPAIAYSFSHLVPLARKVDLIKAKQVLNSMLSDCDSSLRRNR